MQILGLKVSFAFQDQSNSSTNDYYYSSQLTHDTKWNNIILAYLNIISNI